jgi:hypothetical protein
MTTFFTADTHFGDHRVISIHRRPSAKRSEMVGGAGCRIAWIAADATENRQTLPRWHLDHAEAFADSTTRWAGSAEGAPTIATQEAFHPPRHHRMFRYALARRMRP